MHRRGGDLGEQGRAASVRFTSQLVFRQRVDIGGRRIRTVAELLVIRGRTGAGQQEGERRHREPFHFFFFFRSGFASSAPTGTTSERDRSARYASTLGSSGRRARSSSHTVRAANPSPAR